MRAEYKRRATDLPSPRQLMFVEQMLLYDLKEGNLANNCRHEIDFSDAPLADPEQMRVASRMIKEKAWLRLPSMVRRHKFSKRAA